MSYRIRFKEQEWLLAGDKTDGAITTPEAYAAFEPSYAHLFWDGTILRFRQQIGTRDDIEFLEEVDPEHPSLEAVVTNFFHPGWSNPEAMIGG